VDIGSFVSGKAVPQMVDTLQIIEQLDTENTLSSIMVLVAGQSGAQQAIKQSVIHELAYPHSVSETFLHRNLRSNPSDSFDNVLHINTMCNENGKRFRVYLSMAFGNPYNDPWSVDQVLSETEKLITLGISSIGLSDITGEASAETIFNLGSRLIQTFGNEYFTIHLHTQPKDRESKIDASWQAGFRHFETSLGGYGGCPMTGYELVGNMDTEFLLDWCDKHLVTYLVKRSALNEAQKLHPMIV
jgi:hydroxymethylglutaryl-CoA lyase